MIDWLNGVPSLLENGKTFLSLDSIRSKYEVRELCDGGYLVLNWDVGKFWLKFAVMQWAVTDSDGVDYLDCVFHGSGPSGNLRECRHTWWGEDGYVFYPDGRVICAAFDALAEFYGEMKESERA